ncbi:hypothetical protein [Tenacibaculum soleae]|uniref:hypothetical protein n=1 Tax=Tenacibaculum soleae TaxID=447689 RepID=UPI002300FF5D|nr:hypothetical protein [Tenacibaculum soleae]
MPSDIIISNPLKLSDEEFETIENLAACNYSPKQIALYLDLNFNSFETQYLTKTSKVRHHYNKGILTAAFEKDNKMLENAKSGNITAYQESNKAAEKRAFENHKNRILNES